MAAIGEIAQLTDSGIVSIDLDGLSVEQYFPTTIDSGTASMVLTASGTESADTVDANTEYAIVGYYDHTGFCRYQGTDGFGDGADGYYTCWV